MSSRIPVKIKRKQNWNGEFIGLNRSLKSEKDFVNKSYLDGELAIKTHFYRRRTKEKIY